MTAKNLPDISIACCVALLVALFFGSFAEAGTVAVMSATMTNHRETVSVVFTNDDRQTGKELTKLEYTAP